MSGVPVSDATLRPCHFAIDGSWAVVVLAIGFGLASVFSALSLASDDGAPSVASVFLVVVWAFLSGMSVADLIIPVAPDGD